jgi:hypothetical protein
MKLLSVSADAKTVKGEKKGYLTGILYLAPADTSGVANVCANSSPGCRAACLFTAGRAGCFPTINEARIRKTQWFFDNPLSFQAQLHDDIQALVRKAYRLGLKPCVRLNGTSDLPRLAHMMAQHPHFKHVQFYDYSAHPRPWLRTLSNYHLTFSLKEDNLEDALECLRHKINVAVVFDKKPFPKMFLGRKVYDGDENDLRFKTSRKGIIVGLIAKGQAKKDRTGFVQRNSTCENNTLVQITESGAGTD